MTLKGYEAALVVVISENNASSCIRVPHAASFSVQYLEHLASEISEMFLKRMSLSLQHSQVNALA